MILLLFAVVFLYMTENFETITSKEIPLGPFMFQTVQKDKVKIRSSVTIDKPMVLNQKIYVYNPSIAYDNNGEIVGVSRLTGKIASECKRYDNSMFVKNEMVNRELEQYGNHKDNDFYKNMSTVIYWKLSELPEFSVLPLFSSKNICEKNEILETSQGIEDPRLFRFRNELWIYGHFRGFLGECLHTPIIVKATPPYSVENVIKLKTHITKEYLEKNWMPFEYKGELYFVYSISPHMILKCNVKTGFCYEIYRTDRLDLHPLTKNHLGGGAPPVLVKYKGTSYFLTVSHTRNNTPRIIRKNFFYLFRADPPFDIVAVSKIFNADEEEYHDIEFASGLLVSKEGHSIIVSYGISDCYSVMKEYALEDLFANMFYVGNVNNLRIT